MMKMRTRKPAAIADNGSAIHRETATHAYIAAHVAKNPPNDVASCVKLRAKIGDWKDALSRKTGSISSIVVPIP